MHDPIFTLRDSFVRRYQLGWYAMNRQLFDTDWKFHEGDFVSNCALWGLMKAGTYNQSANAIDYDDAEWETVQLPHDYVIRHPVSAPPVWKTPNKDGMEFIADIHVARGSRTGNVAWYRKKWKTGKIRSRILISFDGIYRDSELYVNQFLVKRHQSGYTGFSCDITDFLREDFENVIAVRVDSSRSEGWFYEGGGIYRHVWLTEKQDQSFTEDGIFVSAMPGLSDHDALVSFSAEIQNVLETSVRETVHLVVLDPDGVPVAATDTDTFLDPFSITTVQTQLRIPDVSLWDPDHPVLYCLECSLLNGETRTVSFGIRRIEFTVDHGFWLNGNQLKIKGVCCHEDHAGLGMARPDGILEYRIRKLKAMGANAYRCAHNPVSEELLSVCDRLGMMVMVEQRMMSSAEDERNQLETLVRLARNHPSVILYSIGNEEAKIQFTDWGKRNALTLRKLCHRLDPTRPVTAAVCMWEAGGHFQTVTDSLKQGTLIPGVDIFGFNYYPEIWDEFHRTYPQTPLIVTEDSSFTGTRGCHLTDPVLCHYDMMEKKDGWPYRKGEEEWVNAVSREYIAGTFIWTGFDYYGEPSPYGYPAISSQFGIMDLCGFPKDMYYYYRSWWQNMPVLHLCQNSTEIWCMTNVDRIELTGDGMPIGSFTVERNRLIVVGIDKKYAHISAVGYIGPDPVLQTEWDADAIADRIEYEESVYPEKNGTKTLVLDLNVTDQNGQTAESFNDLIRFEYDSGSMIMLGTGNGNPVDHDPVILAEKHAFAGRLQAIFSVIGENTAITVSTNHLPSVRIPSL